MRSARVARYALFGQCPGFGFSNVGRYDLVQSGRSTRSAVDIFNTLPVFTKEPIREQEIKLECMNKI